MPTCQECGSPISVEEDMPEIGDIVIFPTCGAEHEVISDDPFEMELIEEEK